MKHDDTVYLKEYLKYPKGSGSVKNKIETITVAATAIEKQTILPIWIKSPFLNQRTEHEIKLTMFIIVK